MVRWLQFEPLPQAQSQHGQRYTELSRGAEEPGNRLIERQRRSGHHLRLAGSNVDSTAAAELYPAFARKLTISRADRVGMQVEAPRQIACAGQALPGRQVVAQYAEHDLSDDLFADRDFAAAGKPELHNGNYDNPLSTPVDILSEAARRLATQYWNLTVRAQTTG